MTLSTTCPSCGATMWRGSLHCCPRRNEPAPPPPGSSPLTYLALAMFVVVVGLVGGWALWEWAVR